MPEENIQIQNSEPQSTEHPSGGDPAAAPVDAAVAVVSTPEPPPLPDLRYPEGMTLDQGVKDAFEDLRHGRIDHQTFLDGFFRSAAAASEKARKAVSDAREAQAKAWRDEMAADPDFGGDRLQETGAAADRALKHLSPDGSLAEALRSAGLQRHPAVLKAFAAIGRGLSEDTVSGTDGAPGAPPDETAFLKAMYGPR